MYQFAFAPQIPSILIERGVTKGIARLHHGTLARLCVQAGGAVDRQDILLARIIDGDSARLRTARTLPVHAFVAAGVVLRSHGVGSGVFGGVIFGRGRGGLLEEGGFQGGRGSDVDERARTGQVRNGSHRARTQELLLAIERCAQISFDSSVYHGRP